MVGGVVAVFFGDTMVDIGVVVELFCPIIKAVVAATGTALVTVFEVALTICAFGVAGGAGVMTALLCCIQNLMPMSPAMRIALMTNK